LQAALPSSMSRLRTQSDATAGASTVAVDSTRSRMLSAATAPPSTVAVDSTRGRSRMLSASTSKLGLLSLGRSRTLSAPVLPSEVDEDAEAEKARLAFQKSGGSSASSSTVSSCSTLSESGRPRSISQRAAHKVSKRAHQAATKLQATWRKASTAVWLALLDKASGSERAMARVSKMLLGMGDAGGQALGKLILFLAAPGNSALSRTRKRALVKLLRSAVKLVNVALKTVLPRYLKPSRRKVQKLLAELHNSGEGQPLGEEDSEGIAKNLLLEVLRADSAGRLWRRVVSPEDGSAAYELVPFGPRCWRQPACPFDSEPVQARGLVKRCTCRVDTKLIKAEKGVSKAEARRRQV